MTVAARSLLRGVLALGCLVALDAQGAIIRSSPTPPDTDSGFYATARFGGSFLEDVQPDGNNLAGEHLSYEDGLAGGGAVGYALGNGPRLEAEADFRYNSVASSGGFAISQGRTYQYAGFLTGIYDIDLGLPVVPHIGGGVGGSEVVTLRTFRIIGQQSANTKDLAFSYKLLGGFEIPLAGGLRLGLEYQYVDSPDVTVPTRFGFHVKPTASLDYANHTIFLTLRYDLDHLLSDIT